MEASNIVEHTREVIKYNKLDGVIEVMKDYAEDIVLDERVDLIVSEWMGTILLVSRNTFYSYKTPQTGRCNRKYSF